MTESPGYEFRKADSAHGQSSAQGPGIAFKIAVEKAKEQVGHLSNALHMWQEVQSQARTWWAPPAAVLSVLLP